MSCRQKYAWQALFWSPRHGLSENMGSKWKRHCLASIHFKSILNVNYNSHKVRIILGFLYLWSINSQSNWIPWMEGEAIIYCRYNNGYKEIKILHAIYKLAWYTIEESVSYGKYTLIVSPFFNKEYTHMNQCHMISENLSPSFVVEFEKIRYFVTKYIYSAINPSRYYPK